MRKIIFLLFIVLVSFQCKQKEMPGLLVPHGKFIEQISKDSDSFYFVDKKRISAPDKRSAIGVFDSGIGGLTVFDAIINADFFNMVHENKPDGLNDFHHEQFLYLADQANMPYSNYVESGKGELLVEHILKDALFLLNNRYHLSPDSPEIFYDKPGIKALVIACNTATAYGKGHVEELYNYLGTGLKVIGVIDAGCKGALEVISPEEDATVAIFATPATVSSEAYVTTLNGLAQSRLGRIAIIQQGGKGLHESIDNKPEFINKHFSSPYKEYQGPSLRDKKYRIDKELFPYYNFNSSGSAILFNGKNIEESDTIQLNSVENYTRFHIVSLIEQIKEKGDNIPLKAIILGCTHYPYVSDIIDEVFSELRQTDRYSALIGDSVYIIDPALNTARELYRHLYENNLFNSAGSDRLKTSRFYISVPNKFESSVQTEADGKRFRHEYQYFVRGINELKNYTLQVPLSGEVISREQLDLIQQRLPLTYKLIMQQE